MEETTNVTIDETTVDNATDETVVETPQEQGTLENTLKDLQAKLADLEARNQKLKAQNDKTGIRKSAAQRFERTLLAVFPRRSCGTP